MTQKTVLNETHRRLGAKMVDFGGWDMPLHYGSQIEEHHAVRGDCGMFDVSHMCAVDVTGPDARTFLLRLVANNVDKLKEPGKALYSAMLNESGGVVDDLIVYFLGENRYRVVINAGTADKDLAWMAARIADWKLNVTCAPRRDLAMIAVQGPNAKARVWQALPGTQAISENLKPFHAVEVGDYFIATTGYTGEAGFEITLPASQAEDVWQQLLDVGVRPIGLGARDTLRLEAGMNLYGQDMNETQNPLESGLTWTLDFKDASRDFNGKSALARRQGEGNLRQLLGLVLLDKGVLRSHQKVVTAQGDGETTSGSFAPTLNQSIAFARVPAGVKPGDEVQVDIRGKLLKAKVVKPPFARNGNPLI